MIRGYDSLTLIKCFPTYFMCGYLPTLNPKMIHMLVIIPCMERFGAGMLVPLECRCKVLVQGAACCQSGVYSLERAWHAGGAQGAAAGSAWAAVRVVCVLQAMLLERACW